eukprot:759123-Prorocentrum_minimum.AAC.3
MFPPPPRNDRYLAAARVARRGGFCFRRAGRPGPAKKKGTSYEEVDLAPSLEYSRGNFIGNTI